MATKTLVDLRPISRDSGWLLLQALRFFNPDGCKHNVAKQRAMKDMCGRLILLTSAQFFYASIERLREAMSLDLPRLSNLDVVHDSICAQFGGFCVTSWGLLALLWRVCSEVVDLVALSAKPPSTNCIACRSDAKSPSKGEFFPSFFSSN